uniref:Ig-like domain-containing protein n=1 Tax=Labrus bergylta TaxID=56723 RepID=A0A3Q3FEW4_9LABR
SNKLHEQKHAPKLPSVSVSPSAEIVEGSSVTLTCSSDANPAPEYTWFKENNNQPLSREAQLVFSSIKSSDSGEYLCKAENDLGKPTYKWISIDVKCDITIILTFFVLIFYINLPSAEIVEGSSVTLTCSSDANPAANYTWYKEDEDSPTASGQIFNINNTSLVPHWHVCPLLCPSGRPCQQLHPCCRPCPLFWACQWPGLYLPMFLR